MGVSTDGQLCYGILIEEGFEFPWEQERWDYDIEDWWVYGICGYTNPIELYDAHGEYLNGREPTKEEIDLYYNSRRAFSKEHPVPIKLVNYCSGDYPMWILATPGSCMVANRGYPKPFEPEALSIEPTEEKALLQFCIDHKMPINDGPQWWLSSYWG